MPRSITAALVVALCGVSAGFAEAQRFGRGQTPAAGACFYENPDFQGDYFCVRAGDVVESLPRDMNDRISSIRVESLGGFGRRDDQSGFGARGNQADRIVRRAYQDILNREPDVEGLRVYRSRVIDEGWTEQQVREGCETARSTARPPVALAS